jgi:hypothetical protein
MKPARLARFVVPLLGLAMLGTIGPVGTASAAGGLAPNASGDVVFPTADPANPTRYDEGFSVTNGSGCMSFRLAFVQNIYVDNLQRNEPTYRIETVRSNGTIAWHADQTFGGWSEMSGHPEVQGYVLMRSNGNLEEWSHIASDAGSSLLIGTQHNFVAQVFRAWQSAASVPGGQAHLVLQNDGNLVVKDNATGRVIWQTGRTC